MAEKASLEEIVLTRLVRLNAVSPRNRYRAGRRTRRFHRYQLVAASAGGEVVGPHLSLLGQFFIGYELVSWEA